MALDEYFFKQRYRKEINETASEIDSIDETAEAGVIETEEVVIYHFQNVAEYTTIERDLTNAIKVRKINFYSKFPLLTNHNLQFTHTASRIHSQIYSVTIHLNIARINCQNFIICRGKFSS